MLAHKDLRSFRIKIHLMENLQSLNKVHNLGTELY